MRTKIDYQLIEEKLDEMYPNAHCELNYKTFFQLLIAVMLSAQTTDNSVNKVTPKLFELFPTPFDLANAKLEDVENCIKSLGLYKNKSKNLIEMSKIIVEKYNGNIPSNKEELINLPGVGIKTASVVLVEGYKIPAFPVDTHVERISKRLGIAPEKASAINVMEKLMKKYSSDKWGKLHHQMIFFGRYTCKAQKPNCHECKLIEQCRYLKNK